MVYHVNLVLYLICHHASYDEVINDARVIQRTSIEKGIPITYFFSGLELNALHENRDKIYDVLWTDLVGTIRSDLFVNPRFGNHSPYKPELGIMPFHHIPLVQPWHQYSWGDYFDGFLEEEITWSEKVAEQAFHKTPVTIYPPDGVYAPAAAHTLRQLGLDTVVTSGEFLGNNRHAKGVLYWASGLRHLMRTNDLQPQNSRFSDARSFVEAVEEYGQKNDVPFVVVGCDIDEFNGMRGLSLHDGVARLCNIGDEAYRRGIKMINCNAAAQWNLYQTDIYTVWPWNDVHSMIDDGNLDWLDASRNLLVSDMISLVGQRYREGWDVRRSKDHIGMALDIALRNRYFCYDPWLTDHFYGNINAAITLLQGWELIKDLYFYIPKGK